MKRIMLVFAGGLAAALMMLLLSVSLGSGSAHAQTPTPTATATPTLAPVPHYECYNIAPPVSTPTLPKKLTLETQFGTEIVENAPIYTDLCLPTTLNGAGNMTDPHVECLPISGRTATRFVNLTTQWGTQENVKLGRPIEACMPAKKAIYPTPVAPPVQTVPHYECYEIIDGPSPPLLPPTVMLKNQFDLLPEGHEVEVGEPTRLCLPAKKNGEGSLTAPHVECFALLGGPAADKYVNLLTQFLPVQEHLFVVGPARELCVPVLKTVLKTGIGGIAEAPDADASALEATASGGSSGTTYAAIAGIAAGLVVLGAGGWYARRRWLS